VANTACRKNGNIMKNLYKAIEENHITVEDIAEKYQVTPRTVQRWISNETKPKIEVQYEIEGLLETNQISSLSRENRKKEELLRFQLDNLLISLRESFHRWGKYSSRNEALEELFKLILAQFSMKKNGENGFDNFKKLINNEEQCKNLLHAANTAIERLLGSDVKLHLNEHESHKLAISPTQTSFLQEISKEFSKVDWHEIESLHRLDLFNEIFGKFLANSFVDEKELGQYLTPIEMTSFMTDLVIQELSQEELEILTHPVNCKEFGFILDPSCGAGSFLTELVHHLMPIVYKKHGEKGVLEWLNGMGKYVLCGLDKSNRMLRLTIYSFSLLGIPCTNVFSLNSLDTRKHRDVLVEKLEGKVKIILTNPPFGAEFQGDVLMDYKLFTKWSANSPRKIDSELLFVEKYVDWLCEGGKCAVVVPDSILTNRGIFSELRKGIHNNIEILSVISFPSETFSAAGTSTKTSVFFFLKGQPTGRKTYFGICNNIGFRVITKGSNKVKIPVDGSDLDSILAEASMLEQEAKLGRRIIFDDSFDRWDANYHASLSSKEYELIHKENTSFIRVSDVADLINDRLDPRRLYKYFNYVEISDIQKNGIASYKKIKSVDAPSRARKVTRPGDVLASTVRPDQKKIGYILNDNVENLICTTGLAVLRPKGIEPELLVTLLKSDFATRQLLRYNIGIAYPAIDEYCLMEILLPMSRQELQELNVEAEKVRELKRELNASENRYRAKVYESLNMWMASKELNA